MAIINHGRLLFLSKAPAAIRLWMQDITGFAVKQKSPGHQDSGKTSQSSIVVSDSCQPGTAASTDFRGLPGLFLYYRLSEHKGNIVSMLSVASLAEHLQEARNIATCFAGRQFKERSIWGKINHSRLLLFSRQQSQRFQLWRRMEQPKTTAG